MLCSSHRALLSIRPHAYASAAHRPCAPVHARAARAYPWPSVRVAQVSELHANTAVDELVLSSCCEAMLAEETPLSDAAAMQLAYLEGQLAARPGIANAVVRAAAA
jgi:hypothetical protein